MKYSRNIQNTGRAQTDADFKTPQWNGTHYIADEFADSVQHWQPGAKTGSYEDGEIFAYRILPEIADQGDSPSFFPARMTDGSLSDHTIWPVNVIEKFGFERKVSFIPTLPYVPVDEQYEPYCGPYDNPYRLLTTWLWNRKGKGKQLPKEWVPLVMTTAEINEYRKQNGLWNSLFATLLLPLPKFRYFSYALIYRGYDTKKGRDFEFNGMPFGVGPKDGLQVVSINQQAYDDLKREYARKARTASGGTMDEFYFPDPAEVNQGTINHIRNRNFPDPVNGDTGKPGGFGYAGAVESRYHLSADKFQEVDLRLSPPFLKRYYEQWQPWPSVLKGTVGIAQVKLIARYAPELKSPCEQAWEQHPALMDAWQKAFAGAPDEYDFHKTLHRIYGTTETEQQEGSEKPVRRYRGSNPPTEQGEEERTRPVPKRFQEEMPASPMVRPLPSIDTPETTRPPRAIVQPLAGPLEAVSRFAKRGPTDLEAEYDEPNWTIREEDRDE